MWKRSCLIHRMSSKIATRSGCIMTATSPTLPSELRRREHRLEQLIDLAQHAARRVVVHGRQRGLDLVQVLELREELDVRQLGARGEQLADELQLAEEIF